MGTTGAMVYFSFYQTGMFDPQPYSSSCHFCFCQSSDITALDDYIHRCPGGSGHWEGRKELRLESKGGDCLGGKVSK